MICYDRETSFFPHISSVEQVYCLGQILSCQNKTKKTQKDLKIKDASVLPRSHKFVTLSTDTRLSGDLQKGLDGDSNMGRNKVSWGDKTYGHEPRNWSSLVKMYGDSDTTQVWDPENENAKQVFKGATNKDNNDSKRKKKNSYSPTLEADVNMYGDTGTKSKSPKRSFKEKPMQTSYEDNDNPKRQKITSKFHRDRNNSYSPSHKEALLNCDQNCCKCIRKNQKLYTQPKYAETLEKSSKQNKAKAMQQNVKFEVKPREECDPNACDVLYRQYQTKHINNYNDKNLIEAPANVKKKLKQNNRAEPLHPEIKIEYPYKDIDICPEGLCVEAAMKNKTDFNCKCSRIPDFPKECTDLTCGVSPMTTSIIPTEALSSSDTLSSKTLVTIGKIKCLCRKYSQKITSRRRRGSTKIKNIMVVPEEPAKRNICDYGICHAADQQNISDFTCKCNVVKECTEETCNVKKQKDMNRHENNDTKKTKELQTKKKKLKGKRNIAPTAGEGDKLRNDNKIKEQNNEIINQGDQSGEPVFEMKINYNNMCVLNPDVVNDKVKSMKEILRKTCVCPSHKRRRRHYLLDTTCRAGPCRKAHKNKRTNFTCTCSKPHTECFDSTCKEHSKAMKAPKHEEPLKTYSNMHDEPIMDILVNPRNMCIVNKDHIFDTLKNIQKEKREPCSTGICKDKENKVFKCFRKQNSFICNCLNKNKKEEITSCSEPTCSKKKTKKSPINSREPVDYIPEQQTPMVEQPVVLTPSNFLSYCRLKCMERSQRRQAEREAIKKGALLCKDKICARPGTYHSRDGFKISVRKNEMHEMNLCNCKECNKKRKKIKEKPKYQCGDMICHDTILKQPGAKKRGYERRQVKLYGGSTGDGCRCCVCGKGPAECTCTCLSKILHARKYVCASVSTLINTINTLRGRPPPLPEAENNKKGNIKHTCECHKEVQKLKKKPKKKPKPKKVKKKEKIIKKRKKVNDNTAKRKQLMNEDRELKKSERRERRRAEKKERKLRKQQLKDLQALVQGKEESQDTNCCADFIVGIFKIGLNIVKTAIQILFITIFNPKGAYRYARLRIMDPSGTVIRLKKWFMDFVYLKKMEIAKTMSGSHTMIVLSDTFKDSLFYKAFSSKGRTKEERQKLEMESKQRSKRVRRRHEEAIYSCRHTLLTTLRKTPCLWVYHICPTLYPQCLSLLRFLRSFADIMLFCAALIVWTPCIACCELCRACMCCTVCTG